MPTQSLSDDARFLLDLLPSSGRITNQTGVRITGWDYDRLVAAKYELRDAGLVEDKRGWGGPFGRVSSTVPAAVQQTPTLAATESELYEPLMAWVRQEFVPDDFDPEKDLFEVVISANLRPTGAGRWEVPDIVGLSLKKYAFVPNVQMEAIAIEVKKANDAFNPYGIFEAISQSKFAHRAYYCFEWADDNFEKRADYQRIAQEATAHGVGLMRCRFVGEDKKLLNVVELIEAEYRNPQPNVLNSLIDSFFDNATKRRIRERTGYNLFW